MGMVLMGLASSAQAAGASGVTLPVHAEPSTARPSAGNLQAQLDALNAENALLTVELKNKELRDKINGVSDTKAAPASSVAPAVTRHVARSEPSAPDAKITLISGSAAHPVATILRNGATFNVSPGSTIRGLGVVKSVSLDGVEIQSGTTIYTLPFEADATSGAEGGMSGMGGMVEPGMGSQMPMGMPMSSPPMLTPPPSLPGSR